jgi:Spy/CpxP family protein refolding chaperone
MKKIITVCLAIAAFTFGAVAQDQNNSGNRMNKGRQGMHKGHEGKGMESIEKLNLTEAQRQQIKSINEDFKTRLQSLNQNDNILVKDAKAQRKALMQERKNKIAAILTPEQKMQFEQLHKEGNKGDWKNKSKGEDWKKKRKMEDGKEKVKVKTT